MKRRNQKLRAVAFVYFLATIVFPLFAEAAFIVVTTNEDEMASNNTCSLREAITAANNNKAVDACSSGTGVDTIMVPAGTYLFTLVGGSEGKSATGDLDIRESVSIIGAGATKTIFDANNIDRVLEIGPDQTVGATLTISGVTLQNGVPPAWQGYSHGGGVRIGAGTLIMSDSVIRNNSAAAGGGIHNYLSTSAVSLTNVTVENNAASNHGGGIYNAGSMLLNRVIVRANAALLNNAVGAGIANTSLLTIRDSAIFDNSFLNESGVTMGAGFFNFLSSTATIVNTTISGNIGSSNGGGIYNKGTLTVTNSTVSENTATVHGGGIQSSAGIVYFNNVTMSENIADSDNNNSGEGGGIYNQGIFRLKNSIIAGNSDLSGQSPDCRPHSSLNPLTSDSYNFIGNSANCLFVAKTGDQVGTHNAPLNASLYPLSNYGGFGQTHALQEDSPAFDAGNPSGCTDQNGNPISADQRNVTRSDHCDIGSYEFSCGNGDLDAGESCDDGNLTDDGNGCSETCEKNSACGDGLQSFVEECDDGNTITETCNGLQHSCTVCAADCTWRPGGIAFCGDGITQISNNEECDDGEDNSNILPGACRTNCRLPSCQDGIDDPGEICSVGNSHTQELGTSEDFIGTDDTDAIDPDGQVSAAGGCQLTPGRRP